MTNALDDEDDRSDALGFVRMPQGYGLVQLDSGHWMWTHTATDRESQIHWDRWAIYRSAIEDARARGKR